MKYSLKELLLTEYSEKVYKTLIERFKKQNRNLDEENVRYYIKRFEQLQPKIREMFEKRAGDEAFEKIFKLIPKQIQEKNKYLDILQWERFVDLEKIVDIFPSSRGQQKKAAKDVVNAATTDADEIYNSNGIEIYKGDSQHSCVRYGSKDGKAENYSWCISRAGDTRSMYGSYRFKEGSSRMFYFIFDRKRSSNAGGRNDFEDPLHAIVLHVFENGKYKITNADNNPGEEPSPAVSFEQMLSYIDKEYASYSPQNITSALKSLGSAGLKYVNPTAEEVELQALKGKILTPEQFQQLSYKTKTAYVQNNATTVNTQIFKLLDNDLKNLAINNDRKCSFDELKDSPGLLKRYPVYRYTRYPNLALPPIFIPYLPAELKQKYYDDFKDEFLTYEIIEKYLGDKILKEYIAEQLDNLAFLPQSAKKYMTTDQLSYFEIYSLGWSDSKYDAGKLPEEETDAPSQYIDISPISVKTYTELKPEQKEEFKKLISKFGKNKNDYQKYNWITFGFPTILLIGGEYIFITRKEMSNEKNGAIIDSSGRILVDNVLMYELELFKGGKNVTDNDTGLCLTTNSNTSLYVPEQYVDEIKIGPSEKVSIQDLKKAMSGSSLKEHFQRYAGIKK